MLQTFVNKSRRALLRYLPPQVRRYVPAPFMGPRPVPGPPPGISIEELDAMCGEALGGRITSCAHQHLARWKRHGAYRLHVVSQNGARQSFILKDEIYSVDEIPALKGLPIVPGPPKYYVYQASSNSSLSTFLPRLFWSAEIEPGKHFRYLLQDLRLEYRGLRFNKADLLFAVRLMIEVHKAMKQSVPTGDGHRLILYDRNYSSDMLEYSRASLEAYHGHSQDNEIERILTSWSGIVKYHQNHCDYTPEFDQAIHGDYTLAHIHWKNRSQCGAKVVDWEWAGLGVPHIDLATVLKWADRDVQKEAIEIFAPHHGQLSAAGHARLLRRYLLERKLLDAGFFARQRMLAKNPGQRAGRYFRRTVADLLAIAEGAA